MNHTARKAVILLLKGLLYRIDYESAWDELVGDSFGTIADYFDAIGLSVYIDENDGYAYLCQKETQEGEEPLPKLIPARELSYKVSLLLVLLRKRIADFDMQSESTRAIVSREEMTAELLLFMPQTFDEVKLHRELDMTIRKIEELGFLKKLRAEGDAYEIRQALKGFVDAQWLNSFDEKLQEYRSAHEEKGA